MGPIEAQLTVNAQAVRQRLRNTQPPHRIDIRVSDDVKKLQAQLDGMREQLAAANAEIEKYKPQFHPHPVHRIIELVSKREGISKIEIVSHRRSKDVCFARQIAFYLASTQTAYSLPRIGACFDGRDHTTVLHGRRKIIRLRALDSVLDNKLRWYEQQLGEPALDRKGA